MGGHHRVDQGQVGQGGEYVHVQQVVIRSKPRWAPRLSGTNDPKTAITQGVPAQHADDRDGDDRPDDLFGWLPTRATPAAPEWAGKADEPDGAA